jgi:hypothetical protein
VFRLQVAPTQTPSDVGHMAWRGWDDYNHGWHESRSRGDANWNWSRSRRDANCSGLDGISTAEAETHAVEETTAVEWLDGNDTGGGATAALPLPLDLALRVTTVALRALPLEYFQSFTTWTSNYKQHNIALKYLRERAEARQEDVVALPFDFVQQDIAEITHDKGVHFHFSDTSFKPWYWQEMVAQLDEPSMRFVVNGEDPGRSRGLVSCKLEKSDRYDHKRAHANPGGRCMFKIWDFILVRDDGSKIALHPNYSNTKFECLTPTEERDHEIPRTGLGGTSGPGTFKYFKEKHVHMTLRFDGSKQPQSRAEQSRAGPQSRSQPASSSGTTPSLNEFCWQESENGGEHVVWKEDFGQSERDDERCQPERELKAWYRSGYPNEPDMEYYLHPKRRV